MPQVPLKRKCTSVHAGHWNCMKQQGQDSLANVWDNIIHVLVSLETTKLYKVIKMCVYFRRPENVPRLFDLIKVKDEKVKTAFYFALKDTLVGKDLEQATRISDKVEKLFLLSYYFF